MFPQSANKAATTRGDFARRAPRRSGGTRLPCGYETGLLLPQAIAIKARILLRAHGKIAAQDRPPPGGAEVSTTKNS